MDEIERNRRAVRDLMAYAVPDEGMDEAEDLLDIYRHDRIALDLLHEFYSYLPEAKNDWIREIRIAGRRQGIFLLAAITNQSGYLYLVSGEGIEFQGLLTDGLWDQELLEFFGYHGREKFRELSRAPEGFRVYEPMDADEDICPACHVQTGELHELGCPVELCPWCGGQLIYCTCRYEKLGTESMTTEEDIIRFEDILNRQGRIPYSPEQRPSYLDDGPELIIE